MLEKIKTISAILLGFLIGQGSLFILNSYLAYKGKIEIVGAFGLLYSFIALAMWSIDYAGTMYISKIVINERASECWHILLVRLFTSTIVISILICIHLFKIFDEFITTALLYSILFSSIFWSFNLLGALDAARKAGFGGIIQNINVLLSVLYIAINEINDLKINPIIFSLTFALGTSITVTLQYLKLSKTELLNQIIFKRASFSIKALKEAFSFGTGIFMSQLPGQLYPRMLITLILQSLGGAPAGVFVYAKSITNMFSQLIVAIRKIEFIDLLTEASSNNSSPKRMLYLQKISIITSFIIISCAITIYALIELFAEVDDDYIFIILFLFVFIGWVISSAAGQILIIFSRTYSYAIINSTTAALALSIAYALISYINLYAVIIAEIIMHSLQLYIFLTISKSVTRGK